MPDVPSREPSGQPDSSKTRRVWMTTDDPDEAGRVLREKRMTGEGGWDMAEVRRMDKPPRTTHRWCVFRVVR